jgi:hypothetical protein
MSTENLTRQQLIVAYERMYQHTHPECARACRRPFSCCSPEYCEWAIESAQKEWGVALTRTEHPKLPLMGPSGCIAAPHLRPMCTLHTCEIYAFGTKRGDPQWTATYFELRHEIDQLELKLWDLRVPQTTS